MQKKDIVVGLGEIGLPIQKVLSKKSLTIGYDINPKLMDKKKFDEYGKHQTSFLHIAIPVTNKFLSNVMMLYKKFKPECIILHSTVSPGTTEKLQKKLPIPVIYSATRGVHKRMLKDLVRYTKFFALTKTAPRKNWAAKTFSKKFKLSKISTKQMSKPETLELAKILCDTSYLGWLINYAQITNMISKKYGVDYDEMWSFSDEIHKFLGNRPKLFPGFIGGHCVIPNLELINEESLNSIDKLNNLYNKKIKNAKNIAKKYNQKLNR